MKKFLATMFVAFMAMLALSTGAHAAIDLTAVTAGFADLTAAVTEIGGLILGAAIIAVTFKWLKAMMFGG